jgi:hypothetical protein
MYSCDVPSLNLRQSPTPHEENLTMEDHAAKAKANRAQEVRLAARWSLGNEGKGRKEEQELIYLQLPCAFLQGEMILFPLVLQITTPLPSTS